MMEKIYFILTTLFIVLIIHSCKNPEKAVPGNLSDNLDVWHKAAGNANAEAFFGFMDSTCIYLGTDAGERWSKEEFSKFAKPYFDRGKAWDFKPRNRHIMYSGDKQLAWFDELLDTWMGTCRGSGVTEYKNGNWRLLQYNLSVMVPNEKIKKVIEVIQGPAAPESN